MPHTASTSRLAVIGDVHGEIECLAELLARDELKGRALVFVGDLINRGRSSKEVVEVVAGLVASGSATLVLGNHELAMVAAIRSRDILPFLRIGGAATVSSYVGRPFGNVAEQFFDAVPAHHLSLLTRSPNALEVGSLRVVHSEPFSETPPKVGHRGTYVVSGHRVIAGDKPVVLDWAAWIDTGCGQGGPLTALLWPERTPVQVPGTSPA